MLQQRSLMKAIIVRSFSRKCFQDLLNLAVSNSFFLFNGQLFKQVEGLGMGLPLSPTLANIFMSFHEQKWLADCPPDFAPVFYRRYVDDTFVVFKQESHAHLFFQYINAQHPNISFTAEHEHNNKISFLDVLITKENGRFATSVYRKPTFSGLGMSFFSFCAFRFKLNAIQSLISRAYGICSSYSNFHSELNFLKQFFYSNGFPIKLVEYYINKFLWSKYSVNSVNDCETSQTMYVKLPFLGHHSDKFAKELSPIFRKFFPSVSFRIILVNNFKIGSFFSYKDKLSKAMQSSLVYQFSCVNCTSGYVGCSRRTLAARVAEHAGKSSRTGRALTTPPHSSVREHAETCGSPVTMNQFKILDFCNSNNDLCILESLYIYKLKPAINDSQSSHPLHIVNR